MHEEICGFIGSFVKNREIYSFINTFMKNGKCKSFRIINIHQVELAPLYKMLDMLLLRVRFRLLWRSRRLLGNLL